MRVSTIAPVLALIAFLSFSSCSTEDLSDTESSALRLDIIPETKVIEIEILELINAHRISVGLNSLNNNSTIKAVAYTHTDYMVEVDNVSHDNFYQRRISLEDKEDASIVSENVAYGYTSAGSLVNAWLNSPGHRSTIEGNFTDFDISAEQNTNGDWYYTNIFIRR